MDPEEMTVARQRLGKHVPAATNKRNSRRTLGRIAFCVVHASDIQYVVKGKQTISFSQN
jgi:hypothetical protein